MTKPRPRREAPSGFTLIELLVVILIVVILSVATLAAVLPSFNARRVSEASRILQAALSRARDAAVRSNSPQGIRLLPDPPDPGRPGVLTCSRFIEMESGDAYDDGSVAEGFDVPASYDSNGQAVYGPLPTLYSPEQYYAPPGGSGPPPYFINASAMPPVAVDSVAHYPYLVLRQSKTYRATTTLPPIVLPNPPTSWFYNIRQGEKLQLNDSGATYTVAGPICNPNSQPNVDRLVNYGPITSYFVNPNPGANANFEFLYLVNGNDDDGDGYVDEGFDGIDNDGDGIVDPGFNGLDDDGDGLIDDYKEPFYTKNGGGSYPGNPYGLNNTVNGISYPYSPSGFLAPGYTPPTYFPPPYPNEYEQEVFISKKTVTNHKYTISRRPVPSQGARETALPTGVVIDLTTYNAKFSPPERSVLPVDPYTFFVDIMIAPNGSVIAMDANANAAPHVNRPFFHFWLSDIEDVAAPLWGATSPSGSTDVRQSIPNANPTSGVGFMLPMPAATGSDPRGGGSYTYPLSGQTTPTLKGDRRLLSINTRTGAITSTLLETFYVDNTQYPYEAAERGIKDVQP